MVMRHRPLYVPDLTPSPASVVDMAGRVGCVTCGRLLPFDESEVVGLGFRCRACSLAAQVAGTSVAAHLTAIEHARVVQGRLAVTAATIVLVVLLVALQITIRVQLPFAARQAFYLLGPFFALIHAIFRRDR